MAGALGDLVIGLHADTAAFASDMGRAAQISQREWAKVGRSAQEVGVQIGIGMAAAAAAIFAMGKSAIDAADDLGKMAQRVGLSTESLSALQYSAKLADVSAESLGQGLKKLSVNMVEMQANTGDAKAAFQALGISVESSKGVLKGSDQVIFEIADKFARMEDGAGKTALAVKLFGRAGQEMIPLLNGGAQGLHENAEEAKRFGIVLSTQATKAAEEFNDNLTRLSESSRGLRNVISQELLPWLNNMATQMLKGKEIAGGFASALRLFGLSTITTGNAPEKINALNAELDQLTKRRDELLAQGRTGWTKNIDGKIEDIKKQIEWAKFLTTQIPMGRGWDEENPAEPRKTKAPGLPDEAAIKRAEALLEKYRDKLRGIGDEMMKLEGIDSDFLKMKALIADDKDFKAMSAAQKKALLDAAELLDLRKAEAKDRKELEEGMAQLAKDNNEARTKEITDLITLKNKYIDLGDPIQKYRLELDQIRKLEETGFLTSDQATEAIFKINEQIDSVSGLNKAIEKGEDHWKDYAHAVSTAFEDAVIGGKKFNEVLGSLLKTIAQIILRTTVTKPLEKGIEGAISGGGIMGLLGGLFGGTQAPAPVSDAVLSLVGGEPGYASGTDYVPRTGLALVHQGESIVPAGQNNSGGPVFNVDLRGASVEAVARLERFVSSLHGSIETRSVNAVARAQARGDLRPTG